MKRAISATLSLVLCLAVVIAQTSVFTVERANAAGTEIWRIGNVDSATAEFATGGSGALTYAVPVDWSTKTSWTDFQGKWETKSGNNISYTISFDIAAVPANCYFQMAVYDADNETSSYRLIVNGTPLNVQWVGGRNKAGSGFDGIVSLYWPIPANLLTAGSNTLQIYNPVQNTGNSMTAGGDMGTVQLDYLRLVDGAINVYKPMDRGVGAWWMNTEMNDYARLKNFGGARGYEGALHYFENTFDDDLILLKKMNINYIYTSVYWPVLEREQDVWHAASMQEYKRMLTALRDAGIKTWVDIQYTPQWASSKPGGDSKQGSTLGYEDYAPANWADWDDAVKVIAQNLGDVVDNWLVYNEQDGPHFWGGTYSEYLELFNRAHAALTTYDTIDADGDGVAVSVAPGGYEKADGSSSTDYAYKLETDAGAKFTSVHYHDYNWGNVARNGNYTSLSPNKTIYIDELGSGYWTNETQQAYEQETNSWRADYPTNPPYAHENYDEIRYMALFQQQSFHINGYAAFDLKSDIDLDYDYANGGGQYDYGNGLVEVEPDGSGGAAYTFNPGGAVVQHFQWLYHYNGNLYPVASQHADDARVLVDAVEDGNRIQVMATNMEYAGGPAHTVTIKVPIADGTYTVNFYDPDVLTSSQTLSATGGYLTFAQSLSAGQATRTLRIEIVK